MAQETSGQKMYEVRRVTNDFLQTMIRMDLGPYLFCCLGCHRTLGDMSYTSNMRPVSPTERLHRIETGQFGNGPLKCLSFTIGMWTSKKDPGKERESGP